MATSEHDINDFARGMMGPRDKPWDDNLEVVRGPCDAAVWIDACDLVGN